MTLREITQQVAKAKLKSESFGLPSPGFIYMGHEQYEEFSLEVESVGKFEKIPPSDRETYMGLEVLRVHIMNHFNIA